MGSTEVHDRIEALRKEWYEFRYCWEDQFGSPAVAVVDSRDESASYQRDSAHVFELENGRFAFVTESGCSCYSSADADVTVVSTKIEAEKMFKDWEARFVGSFS